MDNSKGCKWFFAEAPKNQDLGPNDPKFEIFKPDINSMVREAIQNSMDAVDDDSIPVRLSFNIRSFQRDSFKSFFDLKDHAKGCINYWGDDAKNVFEPILNSLELLSGHSRFYYIEISDANTTGMDYEQGNNKTKFHGFLHSTGASNKKNANSGGSFGIGKAAYFALSSIRSIIVSTMTEDANHNVQHVFQGISMLCTHTMDDGTLRTPTGFYGSCNEDPITNPDDIPDKFVRKETGTSINILGIPINSENDKNSIYDEIKLAVLRNFWLAVYNNKLDVTIGEETITSENIVELIRQQFPELADNGRKGNINPRAYLELVINAKPDDKEYLLVNGNLPHLGDVRLYIYRHPEGRGRILYFRIPNMMVKREKLAAANNFFALFICDNPEGDKKLKKLETVAHDDWSAENWKPREIDKSVSHEAKEIVAEYENFIRESIDAAFGTNQQDTTEIVGLDRYLYIPTASENDAPMSNTEALMSGPTGEFKKDGASPTTTFNGKFEISDNGRKDSISIGKVYIGNSTNATKSDDGPLHSGNGHRRKASSNNQHVIPGTTQNNTPDESGIHGLFSREIDVEYRGIAQKENGQFYHYLLINSPEDIENGRIVIVTGREYGASEPLNILESQYGTPKKNSISNLQLKRGMNRIKVRFADNMCHTLTIDAYEDK